MLTNELYSDGRTVTRTCKFNDHVECTGLQCDVCAWSPNLRTDPVDNVNHPDHYTNGDGVECIDAIKSSMSPEGFQDYCKGNVMKYIWHWRNKGGVEDLRKANVYLTWLIESAEECTK